MTRRIAPEALARHLARLPGPRRAPHDRANIAATLDHLSEVLAAAGWVVRRQPCHDELLGEGVNLIARLPGATDELIVVGAHHDTVADSPGADDNGSGLAALLELARLLGTGRWRATIELVAFDFEERSDAADAGSLFAGSRAYVAGLEAPLRGAFVYDLIAYASAAPGSQRLPSGLERLYPQSANVVAARGARGDFLVALGDAARGPLRTFEHAAAEHGLPLLALAVPEGTPARDLYRSDHVPFWEAGLPALMLTDTANFRNPNYHLPTDTPDTLDADFWARVVEVTYATVAELAS